MNTLKILSTYWQFNFPALLISVLFVIFHFRTNGNRFNRKSILFMGGIAVFLFSTFSPVSYMAEHYFFSAHMIKHIIILLVVPPMLLSSTDKNFLEKLVKIDGFKKAGKFLFHPVTAWLAGVGSMWIWHIPSFYNEMEKSPILQLLQMISLIVLGLIFIWPVFSPVEFKKLRPLQSSLYLFTACVGCTVLGIFITFAPPGIYTSYYAGSNTELINFIRNYCGITPRIDQQMGGLIMWIPACFVYLTNIMISLSKWYGAEEHEDEVLSKIKIDNVHY